jgi:hypothetical protein
VLQEIPDHRTGAGDGRHVVVVVPTSGTGLARPALLHLHIMGSLHVLQCCVHAPARAARAGMGVRVGDVRALLLHRVAYGRGPTHGARAAHDIHGHHVPHGQVEPIPRHLRIHPGHHIGLRAHRRGPLPHC